MLSSSSTGWVEIDVKCALAYWEQQHRQQLRQQQPLQPQLTASVVGILMIEVHDDEENLLRPGLYFAPPTCDQAGKRVVCHVQLTARERSGGISSSPSVTLSIISHSPHTYKSLIPTESVATGPF